MKKIYFLLLLLLIKTASAQFPASLDSTFDVDGWNTPVVPVSTLPQVKSKMALQADGKVVICSNAKTTSGTYDVMVSRMNTDGSMDLGFGTSGIFRYAFDSGYNLAVGIDIETGGKIVTSGITNNWASGTNETFILRINTNGTLDSSFGTGGFSRWSFSPEEERVTDMKRMEDGSWAICGIIATSATPDSSFIIKVKPTGMLDSSFAVSGMFRYQHNNRQTDLYAMEVLPGNAIIAGGSTYTTGGVYQNVFVVKIDSTGKVDPAFGTAGFINKDLFSDYDEVHAIKRLPNGDIIVSGYAYDDMNTFNDGAFAMKMDSLGNTITGFGTNGVTYFSTPGAPNRAYAMALQPDGKIVLAGEHFNSTFSNNDFMVIRLLANGIPDTSFNNGLAYGTTDFVHEPEEASAVLFQPDGKILVSGTAVFFSPPGDVMPVVARYIGGERGVTMPLKLLSFNGALTNNVISLKWTTTNEINTDYFVVERSTDGINFSGIGKVYAHNTTSVNNYYYTDEAVKTAKLYYRLRITDKDRAVAYSKVISLSTKQKDVEVYPTLISSTFTIQSATRQTFLLLNNAGSTVKKLARGANDISTLPAGRYYIKSFDGVIAITKQ